jgi:hypothetical protein
MESSRPCPIIYVESMLTALLTAAILFACYEPVPLKEQQIDNNSSVK